MRPLVASLTLTVLVAACGSGVEVGPVRLDVPDGWRVTRSGGGNLQIADGTSGSPEDTEAGTATAVFDVYTGDPHTLASYRALLERLGVEYDEERIGVDGTEGVLFAYSDEAFGGSQVAVLFPAYEVRLVYRAAFKYDRRAFDRGRDAFERSVRSIRFRGAPSGERT